MNLVRLLVDAGNSRTKFGLFDETPDADGLPKCWRSVTISVGSALPWSQVRDWLAMEDADEPPIVEGFLAGSNPAEIDRVKQSWPADWPAPLQAGFVPETFPLKFQLPEPNKAGIDRLLNAVAANCLRDSSQAALIVDSGTATTIDTVNQDGAFLGGAILPGFELCAAPCTITPRSCRSSPWTSYPPPPPPWEPTPGPPCKAASIGDKSARSKNSSNNPADSISSKIRLCLSRAAAVRC